MAQQPIQQYTKFSSQGNVEYWYDALGWIAYNFAQLEWSSHAIIE